VVPAGGYRVLGTELVVKDVDDLAEKLKDQWVKPADKGVAELEADVHAEYEKIKAAHPKAVLVTLREGDKGSDPATPDKLFTGWMDAGTPGHEPLVVVLTHFGNTGRAGSIRTWFRSHPALLRVDLSSLPKGAEVLAARLIVARSGNPGNNWDTKPTMFVVEPVRRPWNEYEVNVFEYAKDAVWSDYGAQSWGEGGDCDAVMLAHGPIAGKTLSLDFTEAVKYWTDGQHENHGFILYGALDRLSIATRESGNVSNRPAVMVIYEPK